MSSYPFREDLFLGILNTSMRREFLYLVVRGEEFRHVSLKDGFLHHTFRPLPAVIEMDCIWWSRCSRNTIMRVFGYWTQIRTLFKVCLQGLTPCKIFYEFIVRSFDSSDSFESELFESLLEPFCTTHLYYTIYLP